LIDKIGEAGNERIVFALHLDLDILLLQRLNMRSNGEAHYAVAFWLLRRHNARVKNNVFPGLNTMNRRFLLLAVVLCFVTSNATSQGAAPVKQDPAVVRKYLAMRAKIAAKIEKQWRDDFEKTGRLPGEDESEDATDTPPLDAPAKEHLGKSNPDTLIPQLQKELTRLVKLSSNRELDRAEKREAKKQATRVRISLAYIKRHKEEFRKAFAGRIAKLEPYVKAMSEKTFESYFQIYEVGKKGWPWVIEGRFGRLPGQDSPEPNIKIFRIIDESSAIARFLDSDVVKSGWYFEIRGISTKDFRAGDDVHLSGFFHVSGVSRHLSKDVLKAFDYLQDSPIRILRPFDPVAALNSVKQ